jgi:aspartyl protease family protein
MRRAFSFLLIMFSLSLLVAWLLKYYPDAIESNQNKISILTAMILLSVIFSNLFVSKEGIIMTLKRVGGWIFITLLVLTGYSYQLEIKDYSNRLAANVIPGYAQGNGDGSVSFYAGQNGHFEITGLLNDIGRIRFLFDTGATTVALTIEDAKKIGINTDVLKYNVPLNTANGISWAARVNIDKIKVGPIVIHNVEGTVSRGGLDSSLLGMSFLRKLKKFVIKGNTLTLVN